MNIEEQLQELQKAHDAVAEIANYKEKEHLRELKLQAFKLAVEIRRDSGGTLDELIVSAEKIYQSLISAEVKS